MFKFGFEVQGDQINSETRDLDLYFTLEEYPIRERNVIALSSGYTTEHEIDLWVEHVAGQAKQVATRAKKELRKRKATPSLSN